VPQFDFQLASFLFDGTRLTALLSTRVDIAEDWDRDTKMLISAAAAAAKDGRFNIETN
jgi:hypothetical protein